MTRNSRSFALTLVLVGLVTLCASLGWSQATSTSTVAGQVTDPQGAVIVGATVKMVDPTTNTTLATSTNEAGRYVIVNVPSGTYTVTFSKAGFNTFKVSDTQVVVGSTLNLNASLQIGQTSTTVEVMATAGAELQTTSAAVGTSMSGAALQALPNMGRDVSTLAVLQPGTTLGGYTAGAVQDQNTYMLDGGNNSDDMAGNNTSYVTNFTGLGGTQTGGNSSGVMPTPVESIEEFRVASFNQTADFNGSMGGQVLMTTKRGTNQWHGSAYGYYFATNLGAANNWTANHTPVVLNGVSYDHTPLPSNHRDRFGGSLGGPMTPKIAGGKTYFFFNYEGFRFPNVGTYERPVPSPLMRLGVIQVANGSTYVPYNLNPNPVTYNGVTYQPSGLDPRGLGISPIISKIWNTQMPLPNDVPYSGGDTFNTQGYLSTIRAPLTSNSYVSRIDHDFGEKNRWFATYRFLRLVSLTTNQVDIGGVLPGTTLGQPAAVAPRDQVPSYWVTGLTTNLTPTLTNDFRYNYTRNFWQWGSANAPAQLAGLGGAVEIGNGTGGAAESASALIPYNVNTQNIRQRFWDGQDNLLKDDLTLIKGKHLYQFGFSYQRNFDYHMRTDNGNGINNQIVYQVTSSGINFSSFKYPSTVPSNQTTNFNNLYTEVLGMVNQPQVAYTRSGANLELQPVGSQAYERSVIPFYDWYFSDSWHMKPSFTMTWGMGYVIAMPPHEAAGNQVLAVDSSGIPLQVNDYLAAKKAAALKGQAYDPTVGFANVPNIGSGRKYPYDPVYNQFSPRLAVAWNPKFSGGLLGKVMGEGKTVIRAGYGRIYGRLNGVDLVLVPLLGIGPLQPVTCPGASKAGTCLGTSAVDPSTAFRIGADGLVAPLPSVAKNLPQPDFPGVNDATAGDVNTLDPHFRPARTDNVSFTIQREISKNSTLEVGYIGRIIRNEFNEVNLDAVPYMMTLNNQTFAQAYANTYLALANGTAAASIPLQPFFEAALGGPSSGFCKAFASCTAAVASGGTATNIKNGAVSDLWGALNKANGWTLGRTMISSAPTQMTSLGLTTSLGYGNYNAAFMTFRMRDWHGLTALSNFTWGRALGMGATTQASSALTILDPWNPSANYGPNSYDIRFIFNVAMSYQPKWYQSQKGVVGHILGGWTIAPLFFAQSGAPIAVSYSEGSCTACQAFGEATPPASVSTVAEDAVGASHYTGGNHANYNVLPTTGGIGTNNPFGVNMFTDPAAVAAEFRRCVLGIDTSCGGYGNVRGLPQWNLDASILKDIGVWKEGRVGATLNFAFTNVMNHTVMANPSSLSLTALTTFGRITGQANTPRNMEVGLRIHF